jgi:hypothetical protein
VDIKCRRPGLRRSEIAASPTTTHREKKMREMVQFGCSLCIIFASLLLAFLALYVAQVNERKLVCAWCREKLR